MADQVIAETSTGEPVFDPGEMELGLSKIEKLRATALLMAIKYYSDTIIKDGVLYNAMKSHNEQLSPASYEHVIDIAVEFSIYLATGLTPGQAREEEKKLESK
jgi:hypothetical protein